jgi:3-(methylthio)propionyl---CoA ligase
MQDWPLLVPTILEHACTYHGDREIISRTIEGPIHRHSYRDLARRARKLASALEKFGVKQGDILGTMAWNGYRHMEIWYGLMGNGGIVHTLNPRLFADQLAYIINHAEDQYIFLDLTFVPLMEALQDRLPQVKGFILMTDEDHMPETSLKNPLCYEQFIATGDDDYHWPEFDENTACGLCYTSGTTGNPKGVLYSHRSNVLHALTTNGADALGLKSQDSVMAVVPMFHANAWSLVFSAPMAGANLVMPGALMDGASIYEMLTVGQVTLTAAVPTVWQMLIAYLEESGEKLDHLERVVIGGAACPPSMMETFENAYNTQVIHAWGMTEMSPLGSLCTFKGGLDDLSVAEKRALKIKQGRPPYLVAMKISDDDGNELPRDGVAFGHLMVKGPCVASDYVKNEDAPIVDDQGWFDTGDVSTLDQHGYMQITDRAKDVIKSGGEWISSIDVENLAVGHEEVEEAAVIGITHPKWDERPLLVIVRRQNSTVSGNEIKQFLTDKIAKWWMPDDVVFVDEIPHTATGKIHKLTLRETFKDYVLPTA